MPVASEVAVRHVIVDRISSARQLSDALFDIVRPDSVYERPIPERHRIIFYMGHLEAFDWNLLHENVLGVRSFHPEFDRLFAFGIDPVGGGLPSDQPSDWPSIADVRGYVSKIRAALDEKLNDTVLDSGAYTRDGFSLDMLLNIAIEHRVMHAETLSYMLHQLPLQHKVSQPERPIPAASPVSPRMIQIPAGTTTLGLSRTSDTFGWDNEYESHEISVPAFAIDQYMITNQQFLEFISAGGYENHLYWTDADWDWKAAHCISHPAFWKQSEGQWLYLTMFEAAPLPPDWPVYVSQAEAAAYARWAGKSLPSEAEWQRAAYGSAANGERIYPWGNQAPNSEFGNFDFQRWNPAPVNSFPEGRSAFGVDGMLGNGWEWTSTEFGPFAGFKPFPFYKGYSADFFDGKHFVMKGGSTRTAACMLRPTFRNWFQAHYQYVYAGFRCVSH